MVIWSAAPVRVRFRPMNNWCGVMQQWRSALRLRITRNQGLAEDAAQEAFWKAFHALPAYKEQQSFVRWLRTITVQCSAIGAAAPARGYDRREKATKVHPG